MVKIRIKSTREIQEVTRNVAFDLIDRGLAEIYRGELPKIDLISPPRIEDRQASSDIYVDRQMHSNQRGRHSR